MKKREQWITIVFLIFILVVPMVTLVRGFLPQQGAETQDAAQDVLDQNGTMQDGMKGDTDTETQEQETEKQNWFLATQTQINTFTDRLFLKTKMISLNTQLTKLLTGGNYIQSTQVLLGKDDFLFYKTQNDGFPIYDYMGINHFTEEELEAMKNNLVEQRDYFAEKGIDLYVFAAPNKEAVYEQYMPDTVARVNEQTRADQVAEYMWQHSDLTYIYPKQALIEASKQYPVYYKTDTHWNQIGAFVGFQEFYEAVFGQREEIADVIFKESATDFSGDLAMISGLTDSYRVDTAYVIDAESVDQELFRDETILVIGDSFSGFLSTITKAYYADVHWIYTQDFKMSMIEEYEPDAIIYESVERYIERFKENNLLRQ